MFKCFNSCFNSLGMWKGVAMNTIPASVNTPNQNVSPRITSRSRILRQRHAPGRIQPVADRRAEQRGAEVVAEGVARERRQGDLPQRQVLFSHPADGEPVVADQDGVIQHGQQGCGHDVPRRDVGQRIEDLPGGCIASNDRTRARRRPEKPARSRAARRCAESVSWLCCTPARGG